MQKLYTFWRYVNIKYECYSWRFKVKKVANNAYSNRICIGQSLTEEHVPKWKQHAKQERPHRTLFILWVWQSHYSSRSFLAWYAKCMRGISRMIAPAVVDLGNSRMKTGAVIIILNLAVHELFLTGFWTQQLKMLHIQQSQICGNIRGT